jgi:hypothetical protein
LQENLAQQEECCCCCWPADYSDSYSESDTALLLLLLQVCFSKLSCQFLWRWLKAKQPTLSKIEQLLSLLLLLLSVLED